MWLLLEKQLKKPLTTSTTPSTPVKSRYVKPLGCGPFGSGILRKIFFYFHLHLSNAESVADCV